MRPLVIAGPTASGKSALALRCARELGRDIVNLDSVQVYKEASIGSAKPGKEDRASVRHHLLDVCTPDEDWNLAAYLSQYTQLEARLEAQEKGVVLVGGTTLYLRGLIQGIADIPPASTPVRAALEELSGEELLRRLGAVDSVTAARLHPHDRVRLIRALEVCELTGIPFSQTQQQLSQSYVRSPLIVVLWWPRDTLYERIALRTKQMLEAGLVQETESILRRYGEHSKVLQAVGYAEVGRFLRGELSQEELGEAIAQSTRRYAKRQMTFWRNEPGKRGWEVRPQEGSGDGPATLQLGAEVNRRNQRQGKRLKGITVLSMGFGELLNEISPALVKNSGARPQVWHLDARSCLLTP